MSVTRWKKRFTKFRSNLDPEARENFDLALAAFLAREKRTLVTSPTYHGSAQLRRNARRLHARRRSRILELVYGRGKGRTPITDPELLLYRVRDDLLRDTLSPNFRSRWKNLVKRSKEKARSSINLTEFSFVRNPQGTLSQMREIVRLSATCADVRINFVDKMCDDVAPYIVLSHLIKSLPPIFSGGQIKDEISAVLQSVGLDRALGIGRIFGAKKPKETILPFRMHRRAPPGAFGDQDHLLRPQYKEFVADRFCTALEEWLGTYDYELTPNGGLLMASSITEALDNAERHGHPEIDDGMGDWSMAGFSRLTSDDDGNERLECSVAIVSIGSTISESLATAGNRVTDRIQEYVRTHRDGSASRESLLRTVVSLQDGITRVSEASQAGRGGVGLLTLVDFFADLGETDREEMQSVFTILSGDSCLRIKHPYRRGISAQSGGMRELWFNPHNDGKLTPDANHAFSLNDRFAGTILSACFSIDREFLKRKLAT